MSIHVGIFIFLQQFLIAGYVASDLYPSKKDSSLYEVNEVRFTGNEYFTRDDLLGVIASRPTELSVVHQFIDIYYEQGKINPITPISITLALEEALKELEKEYKFMNESQFRDDITSMWHYYNQHGFHEAHIDFSFYPDTNKKRNILEYIIKENERYRFEEISILGLDSLPTSVRKAALQRFKVKKGHHFSEQRLISYVREVDKYLKNNGYYYSTHKIDRIVWDKEKKQDSVTISFDPGNRMKFGDVSFIDFKKDERVVTDEFKQELIAWKKDDWFSQEKVDQTSKNLISLGTFESVKIDTSSKGMTHNDSTLSFLIISNYRQLQSVDANLFFNRTENNLANGGGNLSYSHQNLFNNAQSFHPYVNLSLRNPAETFLGWLSDENPFFDDYQYQVGFNFSQPFIWMLWEKNDMRSGLTFNAQFARRSIRQYFDLQDVNFKLGFPISFKQSSDVTRVEFSFIYEYQRPIDFENFLGGAFNAPIDSISFIETFFIYYNINDFVKNNDPYSTSMLFNLNILGDKRNNPFSPTSGWRVNFILEPSFGSLLGSNRYTGLTEYAKFNFSYFQFWPTSPQGVIATKLLFGGIWFRDPDNNYIPLNKQFFAGGPNSIRGWPSRQLRYTRFKDSDLADDPNQVRFLKDFVGNQALFESSFEFRFTFRKPDWVGETLGEHIASSGITFFLDIGNAFGWLIPGEDNKFEINDLGKLAWATGVGYRYNTPVGPVRLDFGLPIYGPIEQDYEFITSKQNIMSYIRFHIGLGHAF